MVLFGGTSESPVPVVAASAPAGCFDAAIEAARIAIKYRTPVFLLSDAYLANGSEPWRIPDVVSLPDISTDFATEPNDGEGFLPYRRDAETLARPWAIPGTPRPPDRVSLPDTPPASAPEPNDGEGFLPYRRDAETLARPWAIPGTPGLEHRIGGLEKGGETGHGPYDPENPDRQGRLPG